MKLLAKCLSTCFIRHKPLTGFYNLIKRYIYHDVKIEYLTINYASKKSMELHQNLNVNIEVISSGAMDLGGSILVRVGSSRYLFNCTEGVNRHFIPHYGWIFLTHSCWNNISGLKETLMSSSDDRIISIYGPNNIETSLKNLFGGYMGKAPNFKIKPIQQIRIFENDKIFNIVAVPLMPHISKNDTNRKQDFVVAYICHLKRKGGADSVHPGIKRDSNKPELCPSFIVLEIPDEGYLESLLKEDALALPPEADDPTVIFHFSPPEILRDPRYKSFCDKFPASTQHVILNRNSSCLGPKGPHLLQKELRRFYPRSFPSLREFTSRESTQLTTTAEYRFKGKTYQGRTGLKFNILPICGFNGPSPQHLMTAVLRDDGLRALDDFRAVVKRLQLRQRPTENYPEIYFLGTGSSRATLYRNASAILVNLGVDTSILLDCGPGTTGQLARLFGPEALDDVIRRISFIFVSHSHLDHYAGLNTLLLLREKAFRKMNLSVPDLHVSSSREVFGQLRAFEEDFHRGVLKSCVYWPFSTLKRASLDAARSSRICSQIGLKEIEIVAVPHVRESSAISVTHNSGWKLTYSGDCLPNDNLVRLGMNSTVLIHEATLEDEFPEEAARKRHSTLSQAIDAGAAMKAEHVILTHFSQHGSIVPFKKEGFLPPNVSLAFDNMKVTLDDLPILPHLYPVLTRVFSTSIRGESEKIKRKIEFLKKCDHIRSRLAGPITSWTK